MIKRQRYTKEYKREAVRRLEQGDKPISELALELGVSRNRLYKWQEALRKNGEQAFRGPGRKPLEQSDEVTRLRKELEQVKLERDILKKAAAYFAKDLP